MIISLKKDNLPLKTERFTDQWYVAGEQCKILHNEEMYIDQKHENERLIELEMFYKQRSEINQQNYLTFVKKGYMKGVILPESRFRPNSKL